MAPKRRKPPKRLPEIFNPDQGELLSTRDWVGQQCEALWREASELKRAEHISSAAGRAHELWAVAKARSLSDRKQMSDDDLEDHQAEVRTALMEAQGIIPSKVRKLSDDEYAETMARIEEEGLEPLRVLTSGPAPYGVRKDIITTVQKRTEDRFGILMSAEWVKECWDEYRAWEQSLTSDND